MARNILRTERKIFSVLEDISKAIGEGGLSLPASSLSTGITTLGKHLEEPVLKIEIISIQEESAELHSAVTKWIGAEELNTAFPILDNLQVNVTEELFERVQSQGIGEPKASIRVIVVGPAAIQSGEWYDIVPALAADACYVYLIAAAITPEIEQLQESIKEGLLYIKLIDANRLEPGGFKIIVQNPEVQASLSSLFNYSAALSLESMKEVVRLGIEQEQRSLRARQAMNKKQVFKVQANKVTSGSELLSDLKRITGQHCKLLLKGLDEVLDKNLNSKAGTFATEISEICLRIDNFEEIKKSKEVIYGIPSEINEEFLSKVRAFLLKNGQQQLIMMHDSFREIVSELSAELEKNDVAPPALNYKFLTDQKLREILDNTIHWERPYEGTVPKKGFYEYFMAVRKYQMFVFLLASTFGLSSAFKKLQIYMIPLSILILGIGGFLVFNNVRKERQDKKEKELEKARLALEAESKRIATDFYRVWQKVLRDHIDAQETNNQRDLEVYLKNWAQAKKSSEEDEKNNVQRQTQALDNFERKFQSIIRYEADLTKQIDRLKSDLRMSFREQMRKVKI